MKGKILICDQFADPEAYVNAIGSIYLKSKAPDTAFVEPVPAAGLNPKAYTAVQTYFNSTKYELLCSVYIFVDFVDYVCSSNGLNLFLVFQKPSWKHIEKCSHNRFCCS